MRSIRLASVGPAAALALILIPSTALAQRTAPFEWRGTVLQGSTIEIKGVNGDIQAAILSVPHAAKAVSAGMHVLIRNGDYIPRAGGSVWVRTEFFEQNPETVKKFIRAMANAVTFYRSNKQGSVETIKKYLGITNDAEAGAIWDQLKDAFGAEIPPHLFAQIIESRVKTMQAARQWPEGKPVPDPEQFVARKLLDSTLKEMGYVPTKLEPSKS